VSAQLAALVAGHLHDRRRSLLAWGLPLGLMSAFIVAIFPSVHGALASAIEHYPSGLKEAFGIGELDNVEQYLHGEMLSLIVPLAAGYLAARAVASDLSGAAESGRLDVLLSAPLSRRRLCASSFVGAALELAGVLAVVCVLTGAGSLLASADLGAGNAVAGFAAVWPLALVAAGLAVLVSGFSLSTPVVTGAVAGALVAAYVLDLLGKLDSGLAWVRYGSVFKYYGNAIETGIEPLSFCGLAALGLLLAGVGAWAFQRRDINA
jgi:ABC-2 type transport system permease protein